MEIEALYIYPIKSLRGISLPSTTLLQSGFPFDRRFMLLKDHGPGAINPKSGVRHENMHVSGFPLACLFTTALNIPANGDASKGSITVTYHDPETNNDKTLDVPLVPDSAALDDVEVKMHQSRTIACAMPAEYSRWFSDIFGFTVVFAYLGQKMRPVLGNIAPNAAARNPRKQQESQPRSWTSSITQAIGGALGGNDEGKPLEDYSIGFADCAEYLIVSRTSLHDVSSRLPEGEEMDITKFRPNIIVSGAEAAWDEDYWTEVSLSRGELETARLELTANCLRCPSINVDYSTGKPGKGEQGKVLGKLQKDRRVDLGHKYSPVFGRYSFLKRNGTNEGVEVRVGDLVKVTRRNEERDAFKWPGMGGISKEELYPL
ncbi:MAG: hypothetical protein M1828_003258 [Chrysothrix sp. TS-e1954]|nr:MAG: hypothetical protein M1828_003258 [Chrysothrix sp. TS-e1954]